MLIARTLSLVLFCVFTAAAQGISGRLAKSPMIVFGGELGLDYPSVNVMYLPGGSYQPMKMEPLTSYALQFGYSKPLTSPAGGRLEFTLVLPKSVSSTTWSYKYLYNEENEPEPIQLKEENIISGAALSCRLYRCFQINRSSFYYAVGGNILSIARSRIINITESNTDFGTYPSEGESESAFTFSADFGIGKLFRLSSATFLRMGYKVGFTILPEIVYERSLIPYQTNGSMISHSLSGTIMFSL